MMFDEGTPIYQRSDGSYVGTYNGNPYHSGVGAVTVTMGEVTTYLAEHPEALVPEPVPPPPSPEELAQRIRAQRDVLIRQNVDCYNGARWETLSTNRKTLIKNYRQALLDITLQETFPQSVVWPNVPE